MAKSVTLPSGAKLDITVSPFPVARNLYQAIASELKALKVETVTELDANLLKDVFLTALSSKPIESALWACMDRATYKGLRITQDTFEPEDAREDYFAVCMEVAQENVRPFTKSLFVQWKATFQKMQSSLESLSKTNSP